MASSSDSQVRDSQELEVVFNHVSATLSELDLEIVRSVPPGGNWQDIPMSTMRKSSRLTQIHNSGGRTTYYGRLSYDLPSYTINTYFNRPGNGTFIHPEQSRLISIREAARLQSFPDSYKFLGTTSSMFKQVGNAVPPLLAQAVGLTIPPGSAIDLFSGAGGLSHGLEQVGHKVLLSSDINKNMCTTYQYNHPKTKVLQADVSNSIEYQNVVDTIDGLLAGKHLQIVAGGPPCQGFSTAGKWNSSDSRNQLIVPMLDIVAHFRPEYIVIENVLGIRSMNKGQTIDMILNRLHALEYRTKILTLRSEEYGVPQRRRRIFIISSLSEVDSVVLKPLFSYVLRRRKGERALVHASDLPTPICVREAISDLPSIPVGGGSMEMKYDRTMTSCDYQRYMRGLISFDDFVMNRVK